MKLISLHILRTLLVAVVALPFVVSGAHAEPELLARPSLPDARATSRVMLAVNRAGERLVAVGEHGVILLSDDNAKTWTQAKAPVSLTLTNVRFVDTKKGWAVGHGGVVLLTNDRGNTWFKQLDGVEAAALVRTAALPKASNGGDKAKRALADADQLVADGPDKPFLDVYFADERRGIVVGAYGLAFVTEDGGEHWQSIAERIPNSQGRHLYSIYVAKSGLYIAGEQGVLFRSTDGWKSFDRIPTPYNGTYFGVVGDGGDMILTFGLRGNSYRSDDAGKTWNKVDGVGSSTLTAGLRLRDGTFFLANQAGQVLKSSDAGRSFQQVHTRHDAECTGIALGTNGSLVLSGARGMGTVTQPIQLVEQKQ
ncbi:YCF48-related protein [Paraburkholderia sp. BL10I2N1]|uniref:WD40/YVTN/BNR-like repeat-containing protein n=1 Tax=Paraburkholderia sp. BL10I2N1 TaxID=1938796 RepID=UPI00105CE7DC|nr:YCF48-related protein [Paraburkholderia sp. BL10I2N1]